LPNNATPLSARAWTRGVTSVARMMPIAPLFTAAWISSTLPVW
jgi:hypothetical protein